MSIAEEFWALVDWAESGGVPDGWHEAACDFYEKLGGHCVDAAEAQEWLSGAPPGAREAVAVYAGSLNATFVRSSIPSNPNDFCRVGYRGCIEHLPAIDQRARLVYLLREADA